MTTLAILSVIFGSLVGLSLGLTGGGGALFAVPLLVYGLAIPTREAVGISLLTVGITALIGFVQRAQQHLVEFPTGILFAIAGMLGAPVGARVAEFIPESVVLGSFAVLMLAIAARMWSISNRSMVSAPILTESRSGPVCQRSHDGKLKLNSPCAAMLILVGFGAGMLTGLFGVGGGFIIVPALVTLVCMDIKRAVGTSLFIIALVSASGVITHILAGRELSVESAVPFTIGSLCGLFLGAAIAQRTPTRLMQRLFAVAIVAVAVFVLMQNF